MPMKLTCLVDSAQRTEKRGFVSVKVGECLPAVTLTLENQNTKKQGSTKISLTVEANGQTKEASEIQSYQRTVDAGERVSINFFISDIVSNFNLGLGETTVSFVVKDEQTKEKATATAVIKVDPPQK